MKIVIDSRPVREGRNDKPFFAIRLYPETNKEMADLEWGLLVKKNTSQTIKVVQDDFHYAIIFDDKEN